MNRWIVTAAALADIGAAAAALAGVAAGQRLTPAETTVYLSALIIWIVFGTALRWACHWQARHMKLLMDKSAALLRISAQILTDPEEEHHNAANHAAGGRRASARGRHHRGGPPWA